MRHLGWQRQGAQDVAEIVCRRVQLQPNGIGGEAAAGQPGPGDGALALLDVLLRRAALVLVIPPYSYTLSGMAGVMRISQ